MKSLFKISLTFAFLPCLLTACTNAQVIDLSTDKAVRVELAKNGDFESGLDSLCIERLKESRQIIIIGTHANDSDCILEGAFVRSVYFDETDATLSQNALDALGWKSSNRLQREKLALLWAEKGLLAFSAVLFVRDKDFDPYRGVTWKGKKPDFGEFHPPSAVTDENGEVVVRLWVTFMTRIKIYRHETFVFSKDGSRKEGISRLTQ